MINQNVAVENSKSEIQYTFGNAVKELEISKLLRKSNFRKEKGGSVFDIFQFLLMLVFQNCNLYHFLNSKKQDTAFSKNTYYRFLNNARYNWKRFITLLAVKVTAYFNSLTGAARVNCLVIDDSVVPRHRSKKVELLSRVYNHVVGRTVNGFNMLTVGWTDGYSFVPTGFRMLASADPSNRIVPADESLDKRCNGYRIRNEAVMHKPQAAIKLINEALDAGIQASYVLMDTWFTNEPFISQIRSAGLDVIGMLKDNRQKYFYHGRLCTLKQLRHAVNFAGAGNIFGSVSVMTARENIPVKLLFVRNRNRKSDYIVILSTDMSLSDSEIVRIYGNRWSIELFFRAAKSLLCLGAEFQSLSYDMTVSTTSIVFTRYILLEWLRRKANDPKTICELFYVCCDDIQDMELVTALKSLMDILVNGIQQKAVSITKDVKNQLINWFVSQPAFIQALFPELSWEV